jgi:hypothetical protein
MLDASGDARLVDYEWLVDQFAVTRIQLQAQKITKTTGL